MDVAFNIKKYTHSSMTLLEFIESAGGASIVTKAASWLAKWIKIKKSSRPADGIKAIVAVYGEMDWIQSKTSLNKVHIYFLEDSGKTPNAAIPQYMTCAYETYDQPLISNRDDLQKYLVDKSFISVFDVACEKGFCLVDEPQPHHPATKLRDLMLAQRMKQNQFFLIAQTEIKSFYIALSSTTHKFNQLDELENANIRAGVDRIRGIFRDAIKHLK